MGHLYERMHFLLKMITNVLQGARLDSCFIKIFNLQCKLKTQTYE